MIFRAEHIPKLPISELGEGPLWHPDLNELFWVDIVAGKVHACNFQKESIRCFDLGCMVGAVVPAKGKFILVAATERGIVGLNKNGEQTLLADYPGGELHNNRFNDGKCDPAGRFWVGTMNKAVVHAAGNLYCFEDKLFELKQDKLTISNGLDWSPDGRILYFTDTFEYSVYAFDYDRQSGSISNKRVALKVNEAAGFPDGMCMDTEGKLWIAHWGGAAVRRWDPVSGELLAEISVPAPHVTSCTFGGPDLDTLYITTAKEGLNPAQLKKYPLSGSVFSAKTIFRGFKASEMVL